MDASNKENIKSRVKTVPNHEDDSRQNGREPLKTISDQNKSNLSKNNEENKKQKQETLAGPSHCNKVPDTRFVTHRNKDKNEELDWTFEVFKDNKESANQTKNNAKKQSTDPTSENGIMEDLLNTAMSEDFSKNGARIDPAISMLYAVTPELSFRTPSEAALKKVKKSLKRAQNKSAEDLPCSVPSKLHRCTHHSCNQIGELVPADNFIDRLNRDYALDNLYYLLEKEEKLMAVPMVRSVARSCVINWIINLNGCSGSPSVVQLACWYLDRYLSSTLVAVTRLQVIAAACFWIATKLEGRRISTRRMVRYSGNAFLEQELKATEITVLKKLKCEALTVNPYDFIPYLSWFCDESGTGVVEAASLFICQCGLMVYKTLSQEYPSVIATAAVKNAVILLRQDLWLKNLKRCPIYKEAEVKARNLNETCAELREAVRVVASVEYEYKAPIYKYSRPPFYVPAKIIRAVNYKDIRDIDEKEQDTRKTQ